MSNIKLVKVSKSIHKNSFQRGYLDSLDQQEGMACQDQEGCQEFQDLRVTLERMVSKEKLVLLAPRDSRVERGKLVP